MKKIVYIDMDGVLVDSQTAIDKLSSKTIFEYDGRIDEVPGIFSLMEPMKGAIRAFELISKEFDTYVLSTAPGIIHLHGLINYYGFKNTLVI